MAECYSPSPIHALASSILGESSFSSKNTSLSHLPHSHLRQGFRSSVQHQHQSFQPTDHKQKQIDSFEQVWAAGQGFRTEQDRFFSNGLDHAFHPLKPHQPHHHLSDPDLIASWDHAVQSSANKGLWEQSAGLNSRPPPDFLTEFESFHYTPVTPSQTHPSQWASELEAQEQVNNLKVAQTAEDEDDDDEEDEFREEWSNDYFTQAYINSHQSQFQKIQETEQLKEAKLQEEKERLKRSANSPSSVYMASFTAVSGSYPARVPSGYQTRPRLRVPGLDPEEEDRVSLSLEEYAQFNHVSDTQRPIQQPKPVHAQDRFLSLVSDLHVAGQIYYPGASLAALPNSASGQDLDAYRNNVWAQEFAVETELSAKIQKHLGAEWSWEKLFGKDPRKAAERAQKQLEQQRQDYHRRQTGPGVSILTSQEQSEHDRLKAVALSRLQAVFCHLSLTTPPPTSSTTPL
ncbi:hypothetical protein BG006_010118 [Podila minutissima]|uniref:Uncharacterized protein n=1 Tax=Podila minutissima TaxID=64525 RepID=A0A9P5SUP7_9FUNG|nr:hypothetical protein BG006_010118 [Podila minutissima]